MNADALETVCGSNGSEAHDGSCEDIETRLRDMREVVDEIDVADPLPRVIALPA